MKIIPPDDIPVCPVCGGEWRYHDGFLGYESLLCSKCGLDINDHRENLRRKELLDKCITIVV